MREVPFYPFWTGALGLGEAHSSTWIFQAVQGPLCSVESQEKRGSHVRLFVTPWTAASQASLFFTISQSLLKLMYIELVMPSNHLIPWCPLLLCPQLFPTLGTFPISELFASGDQNTGVSASASVLLTSIQGWFPLGMTGLISLW